MAGDWIKMRADLHTHPKVVRIASALKADRLRVVGGLHAAWCLFDVHSVDGTLPGYTPEALDELIGWTGFSRAMESVEWLVVEQNFLSLPQFDAHNGQSAKRRAQEADRKRNARKTSASGADKLRTREEKRREDISNSPDGELGGKTPPTPNPRKRFVKPTLAELIDEFTGKLANPHIEAQKFLNHYETVGWVVGKARTPMKNWKTAVAGWVTRSLENAARQSGYTAGSGHPGPHRESTVDRNSRKARERAAEIEEELAALDAGDDDLVGSHG